MCGDMARQSWSEWRRSERKQQSLQGDRARQGEGKRPMGAVERICIWEILFWFGQMWEPEARPRSQM